MSKAKLLIIFLFFVTCGSVGNFIEKVSADVGVIHFKNQALEPNECSNFLLSIKSLFSDSLTKNPIHVDHPSINSGSRKTYNVPKDYVRVNITGAPLEASNGDEIHPLLVAVNSDGTANIPLYDYVLEPYQKLLDMFIQMHGKLSISCLSKTQELLGKDLNYSKDIVGSLDFNSEYGLLDDLEKWKFYYPNDERIALMQNEIDEKKNKGFHYTMRGGLWEDEAIAITAYIETAIQLLNKANSSDEKIDMTFVGSGRSAYPVMHGHLGGGVGISIDQSPDASAIDFRSYFEGPDYIPEVIFVDKHFEVERSPDGMPKFNVNGNIVSLKILATSNINEMKKNIQADINEYCNVRKKIELCGYYNKLQSVEIRDNVYSSLEITTTDIQSSEHNPTAELMKYNAKEIANSNEFYFSFKIKDTNDFNLPFQIWISPVHFRRFGDTYRIIDLISGSHFSNYLSVKNGKVVAGQR